MPDDAQRDSRREIRGNNVRNAQEGPDREKEDAQKNPERKKEAAKRPGDIEDYSGLNKVFRSKAVQFIINKVDDGTFREFWDDWKWIFQFSRKYKRIIFIYTVLGILSTSLSLVSSVASKYMIDIITGYQFQKLWLLALVMIGSTVVSLIFSSLVSRISTKISIYVHNDIQADIFDQILDADWLSLSKFQNGDLLNRFNNDVGTVANNAVSWFPNLIIALYNFIATFCVIFYYDVTMAWIALSSAPFLLLASRFLMRKNKEYRQKMLEVNSGMMSFETESFYNMDTIKSFGVMGHYSKRLRDWQDRYKTCNLDYNLFSIKTNIGLSLLGTVVSLVSFAYCLLRLWTGDITYGTMTLFLTQRSRLSSQFDTLVGIIPGMLNSSVSAHRIRELISLPRERHSQAVPDGSSNISPDTVQAGKPEPETQGISEHTQVGRTADATKTGQRMRREATSKASHSGTTLNVPKTARSETMPGVSKSGQPASAAPVSALSWAASDGLEVRMRGVDFSYAGGSKVLQDSDFIARPNEIVALVGPSGEGKTTLIRMMLGLIHPTAEREKVEDEAHSAPENYPEDETHSVPDNRRKDKVRDVQGNRQDYKAHDRSETLREDVGRRNFDDYQVSLVDSNGRAIEITADTRRYFAYVPQGNTILSGTIAENLRMVKEDATDKEIIEALKTACAWDFVKKLEGGINGRLGERGHGVSEGQAQRIAIARAVLRDAPVLLLDEATSALDVQTERQVLKNIIRQRPNKTIIVTTHRPSVLDMCQRVYRVQDAKLVELDEEVSAKLVMDF